MSTNPERIAVTGMGLASPIGNEPESIVAALRGRQSGVRYMQEWTGREDLQSHVAGLVQGIDLQEVIPRKYRRTMGRVAQLATFASGRAIADAGLTDEMLRSGRVGLAMGSTTGSTAATLDYYATLIQQSMRQNKSTTFMQVMAHTCAANVALTFGVTGRVWGPNSACTSGSQSIGLAFDTLRAGAQDVMICGGAEEAHFTTAAQFDLVGAASRAYNDRPELTPRPFDKKRDGMVVGEGAGILVLERWEHAKARGAKIYAELLSFATTCDGEHITNPSAEGMRACISRARDAGLSPSDIDYVNAHATGTEAGDPTEAQATALVFGDRVPLSSTKSYTGHTLGACGGIESIFAIQMMRHGFLAPTLHLEEVDPACRGPWLLDQVIEKRSKIVMNNNFAFGGINTSLVFAAA
jgi:3-oxoacyl-[acyl-carrier-protein] synthase II